MLSAIDPMRLDTKAIIFSSLPGHLRHKTFGHLHRANQIGLENTLPHRVVGLAERRVRAADSGVVQKDIDAVAFEPVREGFDGGVIGHVELRQLDIACNRAGLQGCGRIEARRDHAMAVAGILAGEFDCQARYRSR